MSYVNLSSERGMRASISACCFNICCVVCLCVVTFGSVAV